MLNISPVRTSAQIESQASERPQTFTTRPEYQSTLCSKGSKSKGISGFFSSCFAWISNTCNRIWTAIKNAFSKCFGNAKVEKDVDWEAAKETFTGIYQAVRPDSSAAGNDAKNCQRRFDLHYKQLEGPARELFLKHIAFAIAEKNGCKSREAQEKHSYENWSVISKEFKDILADISRTELRDAVISFGKELESH